MEQLHKTLNECNINLDEQITIVETQTLMFQNYNIEIYYNTNMQYFKALDISKALDIIILPENLCTFTADEIIQITIYNKKGNAQITDFLTYAGVYNFIYNTALHTTDDCSLEQASEFKYWFSNVIKNNIIQNYKSINSCICDTPELIMSDKKNITDATRTCRTCKVQKEIVLYELSNKKGNYKTSCITCVDLSKFVCKKCNTSKIGTCYKFSENKIRQRTCTECIDAKPEIFKMCKKCNTSKLNILFGRYDSGDFHNECVECYKTVIKRDVKKCRKCTQLLPVDRYKTLDTGKRNRLCDACRG